MARKVREGKKYTWIIGYATMQSAKRNKAILNKSGVKSVRIVFGNLQYNL